MVIRRALAKTTDTLPKHAISLEDFTREAIEACFGLAEAFELSPTSAYSSLAEGRVAAILWYQQSFRTRIGFEVAMLRLGGRITGFPEPSSSRSNGFYQESLEDVVRFGGAIVDCIIMRHYEKGALARAAAASPVPVLSGGDGFGEHPSQALGDLYHLRKSFGRIDGLKIGIVGDLEWRALRSLAIGLSKFDAELYILPPPGKTGIPPDVRASLAANGMHPKTATDINELLSICDAVTTLGIDQSDFDKAKSEKTKAISTPPSHKITAQGLAGAGHDVAIMHVGPITDEIDRSIDGTTAAHYFDEARDGMWMRMAVLASIFDRSAAVSERSRPLRIVRENWFPKPKERVAS